MIDCERHLVVERLDDLLDHVDATWRRRMTGGEFVLPKASPHPGVELEGAAVAAAPPLDDGVRAAILVPVQALGTAGWLGHELATVFASALNDHALASVVGADPRLRLALALSPLDPAAAAAEVRRLAGEDAVVAACLAPVAVNLGHDAFHPLYAALAEAGLPLIVHPSGFEGTVVGPARLGGIGPFTPEEAFTLLPQVAAANIASLVFDGVFERFPSLRVVFAGFGFEWVPPVLWRADAEWRGLRVEVPWLTSPPSEYIARHIRLVVDGACELAAPGAWSMAELLPESLLLFGSDAPFAAASLEGAPAALHDRIAHENALETFPLETL